MNFDYYRLYLRNEKDILQNAIICKTLEEVNKNLQNTSNTYILIGHSNKLNMDEPINFEECKVKFVDNLQTEIKVKPIEFRPKEFEKQTKQNRAKRKREFKKEIENYLGGNYER